MNGEKAKFEQYLSKAMNLLSTSEQPTAQVTTSEQPTAQVKKHLQEIFAKILKDLISSFAKRMTVYSELNQHFAVLNTFNTMSSTEITAACQKLQQLYQNDLTDAFEAEFSHFIIHYKNIVIRDKGRDHFQNSRPRIAEMMQMIHSSDLHEQFSNVSTVFRIFLTLFVSNATGERSFSKLDQIKGHLASTMGQERLNGLAIQSIEYDLARQLDFEKIIHEFASQKARKKSLT